MRWTIAVGLLLAAPAQDADRGRVLLVTGHDGPWHDWKSSAPALKEVLEAGGALDVDVLQDPHALGKADLARYRTVVLHFSAGALDDPDWKDPDETARAKLREFVRGGGGLVVVHFACFAFRDWAGYEELAGRVWDRRTGHDPRGPFRVEIVRDHPVTRGLAPFEADDELYVCLAGDRPIDVLATAHSRLTGKDHPMAFTHAVAKGRVFHTPLGHDARAIRGVGTAVLLRRGTLWAAGLPVR